MSGVPSPWVFVKVVFFFSLGALQAGGEDPKRDEKIFTNGWAIKVHGSSDEARKIAKAHGFEKIEPVSLY